MNLIKLPPQSPDEAGWLKSFWPLNAEKLDKN